MPSVFIPRWWRQQSVARDPQVPVRFGELSGRQSQRSSAAHFLVSELLFWIGLVAISNYSWVNSVYAVKLWLNFSLNPFVSSYRNFPGIFGNQQQHYLEVIKRMLVQCMQDQDNPQVSFLCLVASFLHTFISGTEWLIQDSHWPLNLKFTLINFKVIKYYLNFYNKSDH